MHKRALIAAVAAALLVVGVTIPALAVNTQSWEERRIATGAFDAAAASALRAAAESDAARVAVEQARDAAAATLDDAKAVTSAAAGAFAAPLVSTLQSQATALETALATETPDGATMPDTVRPEAIADLNAAVEPLTTWAADESGRAELTAGMASELEQLTTATFAATLALAETVEAEASTALGAAPLATPETRTAVETARDAVRAAIEDEAALAKTVAAYTGAVGALRASQQAAADAAAAAAESSGSELSREQRQAELFANLYEHLGIDPSTCTPVPGGMMCP